MDSGKKIEELDLSKIKTTEIVEVDKDKTEDWEFVSKFEADDVVVPYISFPKMHDVCEEIPCLDKTTKEKDGQERRIYSKLNQESGRQMEHKQEKMPQSVRPKEKIVKRAMVEVSESKSFKLEQKGSDITQEKEGLRQKISPHKFEQDASARKVETVGGLKHLQQMKQKNEMLRRLLVESLKQIYKQEPDCDRLRRELVRALRESEYEPKNEKVRKMAEILRDLSPCDRENGRLRREMIEALQELLPYDQKNVDEESEWLRREIMEAMQGALPCDQGNEKLKREKEAPKATSKYDQKIKRLSGGQILISTKVGSYEEREWMRREWIEAMQGELPSDFENEKLREGVEAPKAASKYDQESKRLGQNIIQALKEESQSDEEGELLRREVLEAMEDASHYQQENERVRQEITVAKEVAAQYEQENERVRREIEEAMQDIPQSKKQPESELSQCEQENEKTEIPICERFAQDLQLQDFKNFTWPEPNSASDKSSAAADLFQKVASPEAMKDLSQYEKENEQNEKSEVASNNRFVRDLQLREFKSFAWQEPPVQSSAAVFQEVPDKSSKASKAGQDNTSTQSPTRSKLQLEATGCESSTKKVFDCDLMEIFLQYFKANFSDYLTEVAKADEEKDLRVKISSKDSVSFKNKDGHSSDEDENKKGDITKENN